MANKNLIVLLLFLYGSGQLIAGDPDPKVINSAGNTLKNGSIIVEYSVGEIAIATLTGPAGRVTQGMLQPAKSLVATGLDQETEGKKMSIFPNPTNGQLFIAAGTETILQANVYGMDGKMALSVALPQGAIDLSCLNKGVYHLELTGKDNTKLANTKIIKQ